MLCDDEQMINLCFLILLLLLLHLFLFINSLLQKLIFKFGELANFNELADLLFQLESDVAYDNKDEAADVDETFVEESCGVIVEVREQE